MQDLLKDNGSFLTFREFSQKYELNINFLNYLSCVQSVKKYMSYNDISSENKDKNNKPKSLELICSVKKGSKVYYNRIIEQNEIYDIPAFMKWERKLELYVDWEKVLKKVRKIKEIKFRWFQLKICHGILVTNCILKRMKIVDNEKCNFCNEATDTIQHYLWYCHHSQIFWMDLERMLRSYCSNCERVRLTIELVLFGENNSARTDETFDLILLTAKFFVYHCRINKIKPKIQNFANEIRKKYIVEKYVHALEMNNEFNRKWLPYINLIHRS